MTELRQVAVPPPSVADGAESLWIDRRMENYAVIVRVAGEVDLMTAPAVDKQLRAAEALVVSPAPVVLDLTATEFFGSAGLALLVEHASRCADLRSRLCVVADHRAVLRPMVLTGLDRVVEVVPTVDRALGRNVN
jgi:anti-anti-sigma factor